MKIKVEIVIHEKPTVGNIMRGIVISHPLHSRGTEIMTTAVIVIKDGMAETKTCLYKCFMYVELQDE